MTSTAHGSPTGSYQGDSRLAQLLARARAGRSVADVRSLLAGVLAAPEGHDPQGWLDLVADTADAELRDQLCALKQAIATTAADGLDAGPPAPAWRIRALRVELARRGLTGFLIPRADEHQGEYVPRRSDRLRWLTGFSGSAGVAVVLADTAAIFVDGRYTLQVEDQVRLTDWERHHLTDSPPADWIAANLEGGRLGYDPWLHTPAGVRKLEAACARAGGSLVACDDNPLDAVWSNQPPAPLAPIRPHPIAYAGREAADKIAAVAAGLVEAGHGAAVLSDPASICWLLNVRGGDVPNAPLVLGFAVVESSGAVTLYTDRRKLTAETEAHLPAGVTVLERGALPAACDRLGAAGTAVLLDPATAPAWFANRIAAAGGRTVEGADPCALPKATKNPVEIAGTRAAHTRDGAALTRFLAWLDGATRTGQQHRGRRARRRRPSSAECRSEGEHYRGPSFDTISGFGPNGAVVHYHATERTNRQTSAGRALSGRFRRPVPGRHDRRHPHGRRRRAGRRPEDATSPPC